eukprot:4418199-Pyramimonas_sp.AAC.1
MQDGFRKDWQCSAGAPGGFDRALQESTCAGTRASTHGRVPASAFEALQDGPRELSRKDILSPRAFSLS